MKYSRPIVSIALAACVFAAGVQARPQAAGTQDSAAAGATPAFATVAKGSKWLTRGDIPKDDESLKGLRAHFNEYDKDHNGKIDASEYDAYVNGGNSQQDQ